MCFFCVYFCSVVARDLAEGFVAVDDGIVDDLSVCQKEAAVGCVNVNPLTSTRNSESIKKGDEQVNM